MQLSLEQIMRAIPHRPPILLLDHVSLLEPDVRIVATKAVRATDAWIKGHFPGHPVFPGVLIIEAMGQAGAVLASHSPGIGSAGHVPYLVQIEKACLRAPVHPGQELELCVERVRAWGAFWKLDGVAQVDGRPVASARLLAGLVPSRSPA